MCCAWLKSKCQCTQEVCAQFWSQTMIWEKNKPYKKIKKSYDTHKLELLYYSRPTVVVSSVNVTTMFVG